MTRPNGVSRGPLEPASWPLWVLAFGGPHFPADPVKQSAQRLAFRQWQRDRATWFADHDLEVNLRVCNAERRRRATP